MSQIENSRSQESALNIPLAERISKGVDGSKRRRSSSATHKFMGQKDLSDMGIVYCQPIRHSSGDGRILELEGLSAARPLKSLTKL